MLNKPTSGAASNETTNALSRRLATETEGEVLFDDGARGRYSTDASIYQVMPVGVFVPRNDRDVAGAIDIARDLKVPIVPRGARIARAWAGADDRRLALANVAELALL